MLPILDFVKRATHWVQPVFRSLVAVTTLVAISGCADIGYLVQSANGHLSLMRAAKPVDDWLADPQTTPQLKAQLELTQRIRKFAVTDVGLPDNASYKQYADLRRSAVVWNVVAAPELSLTLKTWCFPVTGCVGYRGYFEEAEARAFAAELTRQGLEVSVYGVPAYSTLGWLNWAGGDPLLNTFISYPQVDLARLIFHELAHQVVFAKDDTMFNESFATAVERLGAERWLAQGGSTAAKSESALNRDRRAQFRALTLATRRTLADIYGQQSSSTADNQSVLAMKKIAYQNFRDQYAALKAQWIGASNLSPDAAARQMSGYDAWVANANNASFGAQAAYDELVPNFEALFAKVAAESGPVWPRFYDAVKRLADMPKPERDQALKLLARQTP